jgi:sulfoxide reductase catalytic subunit YedY
MFVNRRRFMQAAAAASGFTLMQGLLPTPAEAARAKLENVAKGEFSTPEKMTTYEAITSHNNFYEFGTGKDDPQRHSGKFQPAPWSVEIAGHAAKTGTVAFEDLVKPHRLEERIYRMRCVEAWSMVIPWVGVPLAEIIKRFEPTSKAKFVAFETVVRPGEMQGQNFPILPWPYVEGLRMDEAMNPLSILAVGIYGEEMPNQNGAPIRLVVPWKYGFKSIKSVVKISFVENQPPATWNQQAPNEYGFYSNVNPERDHPRWSQASERRITGESNLSSLFTPKTTTEMFNGYGEQVAHMYKDMDLMKLF